MSKSQNRIITLVAVAVGASGLTWWAVNGLGLANQPPQNPRQWDWLEGTTWFVKPAGLPLMLYSAELELALPSVTQTVYTIERCHYGYFTGRCTVLQGGMDVPNCYQLIGSVTPRGDVILNFLVADGDGGWIRTPATGVMGRTQGEWTMTNQVCAEGANGATYSLHWAPMWQVEEGDAAWESLPWVGMSVPEFMGQCE